MTSNMFMDQFFVRAFQSLDYVTLPNPGVGVIFYPSNILRQKLEPKAERLPHFSTFCEYLHNTFSFSISFNHIPR